ncbi:MAG: hypothetical protein WBW58_08000, partial [Candidatus Acidiferrum sp.]
MRTIDDRTTYHASAAVTKKVHLLIVSGYLSNDGIAVATNRGRMLNEKTGNAAAASRAVQPTEPNPLDFVPDKIPFDTPYGQPISLDRAQAVIQAALTEAKKRNWKMNV